MATEYKVCAASAVRATERPDWAKELDVSELDAARKRRHELPMAQAKAQPMLH
jgi:hypothetical protein